CTQLFPREQFFLFSGRRDAVEVLAGPLELVSGEAFVSPAWDLVRDRREDAGARPTAPQPLEGPVRLAPSSAPPRRVTAALIPWSQAGWLKKLVYALPPTLLRGHRVAAAGDRLIVVADARLDVVPLGTPMQELTTGLYVPVGWEITPR